MRRQSIPPGSLIEVRFSSGERELILAEALMANEYMERLVPVVGEPNQLVGQFTLDDIEDLLGDVAAAANHTEDRKSERGLDGIYERLTKLMGSFDDGNWNDSGVN